MVGSLACFTEGLCANFEVSCFSKRAGGLKKSMVFITWCWHLRFCKIVYQLFYLMHWLKIYNIVDWGMIVIHSHCCTLYEEGSRTYLNIGVTRCKRWNNHYKSVGKKNVGFGWSKLHRSMWHTDMYEWFYKWDCQIFGPYCQLSFYQMASSPL